MNIQLVILYACVVALAAAAPIPDTQQPVDAQSIWCLENFPSRIWACVTNNVQKIPYMGGNVEGYSPLNALQKIDVKIGRSSIFREKKHLKIGREKRSPMKKHKDDRRPGRPAHISKERRKPPHSRGRRKPPHSR